MSYPLRGRLALAPWAALACALLTGTPAGAITIHPGDLLIADSSSGPNQLGAVIHVNPHTGAQTLVSGGGQFVDPAGIAFTPSGRLLVVDGNALGGGGALFAVDLATGAQSVVASGGKFVDPVGLAITQRGRVFIADEDAFGGGGGVIGVNPRTGRQRRIASGGYFVDPFGIALGPHGTLYVADPGFGGIIQVNRRTGHQSVVASGFPDDGPYGIVVLPDGYLLVTTAHHDGQPDTGARVIRVNPKTGEQTIIATGPPLFGLYGIALGLHGEILLPDADAFALLGGIFELDPATGEPTTITSFGLLSEPVGLAVAPTPEPTALLLFGTTAAVLALARRRRLRQAHLPDTSSPSKGVAMISCVVIAGLVLLALGSMAPASAWEADVHYGLTKWLALAAGFTPDAADTVAWGNQEADHGIRGAPLLVGLYACRGDLSASKLVKDIHFPTDGSVPAAPGKRIVEAGSDAAKKRAWQEAKTTVDTYFAKRQADSLTAFGEALHPLQDSWSHQGQAAVPPSLICNSDYAWGHPEPRGGYRSHIADLTYIWPGLVLNAAQVSYEFMVLYLQTNKWASTGKGARDWKTLEAEVLRFAHADTKDKKEAWFAKAGFKTFEFLHAINLEDGAKSFPRFSFTKLISPAPESFFRAQVPDEVRKFVEDFLVTALVGTDQKAVLKYLEAAAIAGARKTKGFPVSPEEAASTLVMMWRVADHGRVTKLGHGDSNGQADGFKALTALTRDPKALLMPKSLSEAVVRFGDFPAAVFPVGDGRYVAYVQLQNAPYEVVTLEIVRTANGLKIVAIDSLAHH